MKPEFRTGLFVVALVLSLSLLGCRDQADAPPAARDGHDAAVSSAPDEMRESGATGLDSERVPPRINAVRIVPASPVPGDALSLEVESAHGEGDSIIYDVEWFLNEGLLVGYYEETLTTEQFRKGDKVEVVVVPRDYHSVGQPVRSSPVVLKNRRPEILSAPTAPRGYKFTYAVQAADPDGDALRYSLEKSPPGMMIDADTGLIEWQVPNPFSESFQVLVHVSDGEDFTSQEFALSPR
jgi:hypothetical protein